MQVRYEYNPESGWSTTMLVDYRLDQIDFSSNKLSQMVWNDAKLSRPAQNGLKLQLDCFKSNELTKQRFKLLLLSPHCLYERILQLQIIPIQLPRTRNNALELHTRLARRASKTAQYGMHHMAWQNALPWSISWSHVLTHCWMLSSTDTPTNLHKHITTVYHAESWGVRNGKTTAAGCSFPIFYSLPMDFLIDEMSPSRHRYAD